MKKHSKFLVLLLSVMMVFTLIPTTAFAEGDGSAVTPELVSETLWAGTESWSSPHFSNIDANDIDVISVSSSDTGILNVECYGDSTNILNYILFPGDPGTAVITVNFILGEEEYTVSGEYTVKAFPVFLSSLNIDGEAISAEDYNYHNFYNIEDYEGTSPNVQFTVAEGWNFDNAYYNRSLNNGNFEEIFLGENLPEEGWTFDFSDDYNKLNTFYVFRSDEGEKIQFGIRFTKSEGGVDPGDETVLDTIEITNINTELIPGEKPEFTAELLSDNMAIVAERWMSNDGGSKLLINWSDDVPEVGEEYIYFITVSANDGYKFANNPTVKYNGEVVGAVITADNETDISIGDIIPPVTITEQEITAVYERVTPFEVIMERDFRDFGDRMEYVGDVINCPDAGDKVTFTFPDGTVKHFEYQAGSSYYTGKFVNTEDAAETIPWSQTHINILAQAYDWEPGGDKNYYEVEFLNYPENGDLFSCRVPVEVSSTPVASVEYEPVPVLLWANDAGRSGMPAGSKVTVTYKDGTSEVFVDDYETHSWISQETNEPIPANDNIYYEIWIERDREDLSCTASYMGVTSEKNYGALYVAQSISLHQEEPMVLKKGKNSTTMTDADGNEYENYELYRYNWFGENDVLTITYKNGMGETIDVDYVTDSETSFGLAEDSPYHSGYPDDHLSDMYITIHMPDQSENHFETGQTYSMDMTYHVVGSNFEYPAFTTEGEPYKVLIKEAGPEDVTSVNFTSGSSVARVRKGETLQLAVSWEPSYANVPADAITWISTDTSVAAIDGNGLLTAVSEGSTQITAQIGNRVAYKNVEVYEEKILTDENVSLSQTVFPYTGNIVSVDGCVLYNGELVPRTYCSFNYTAIGAEGQPPREIGDYKVVITGSYGGYSGSATEYFTIKGDLTRNATNLNVTLDADEYVYSGSPVEPRIVSITAMGKGGGTATLVEGQDYTVSYMNNNAAGIGYVIITAVDDSYYRGQKMIPFEISPLEEEPADYSAVDAALAKVPSDLSIYTEEAAAAVTAAVNAVDRTKKIDEQEAVNAMAQAIEDAIAGLVKKPADYSAVDAALAKVPSDLSIYTEEAAAAVTAAVNAVDRTKKIDEQEAVNAMAQAIEDAIAGLVKKPADYSAVDAALAKVPSDLSIYTEEAAAAVTAAVNAVDRTKKIDEQAEVDAMAQAIESAVAGLAGHKDISKVNVTGLEYRSYTGSEIKLEPTVKAIGTDGNVVTLVKDQDYTLSYENNVNIGNAEITVTGIGNYTGSKTVTHRVVGNLGYKATKVSVTGMFYQPYTGSEIEIKPTVKAVGPDGTVVTLKEDKDYTLSYENNVNIGTVTVTITGKGQYVGSTTRTHRIVGDFEDPATKLSITGLGYRSYSGSEIKLEPTVKAIGPDGTVVTLKKDTDYTLSYKNNKNIGTATIIIEGKGWYVGKVTRTHRIVGNLGYNATKVTVTGLSSRTYTGSDIRPEPTVKAIGPDGSVVTLVKDTDYTLSWADNRSVRTAKITIKGKGWYVGSKTVTFKIIPKGTTISSIGANSKGFTVKWNKQDTKMAYSCVTGYEIQYSTSSTFASGNTTVKVSGYTNISRTVSGLTANKKYYVRVRTYKTVDGVTYYSGWSSKKSVTTKA